MDWTTSMLPLRDKRWQYAALGVATLLLAAVVGYVVVARQPAEDVIEANGQVRGTEVTLSARIPGIVEAVAVREGQR